MGLLKRIFRKLVTFARLMLAKVVRPAQRDQPKNALPMTKIQTSSILKFKYDETERSVAKELQPPMETDNVEYAINWMANFVAMECSKELRYANFREGLPDVSFAMEERGGTATWESPDDVAAWDNSRKVWQELHNVILSVEHLMAEFRAYRDIEKETAGDNDAWASPHMRMIHCLNEAVLQMSKIEDLFLVLLFVNSGASLLAVDTTNPVWQLQVRRKKVKQALEQRHVAANGGLGSNPYLDSLTDTEYQTLIEVFDSFFGFPSAEVIRGYRDKIAHRLQPAVDRPELYSQLSFPIKEVGRTTYGIGSRSKVEYYSEEMYAHMKASLEHYVALLKKLKVGIACFDV